MRALNGAVLDGDAASYRSKMHVLDDPANSARVTGFLATRAERWARTSTEQIRLSANANGPDGPLPAVPDELIAAAIGFEERYGGLAYRLRPGGNHMEYSLDGEAHFHWIPGYGWSMPALLDGSWTWMVGLLLDGRTIMGPGEWPDRLIDRTLEQRLEKHALLTEVSDWPHVTLTYVTGTQVLPAIGLSGIPALEEASGPADLWWYDGESAVHLTLVAWPEGQDHWVLRCFARTKEHLPDTLSRVGHPGPVDSWCSICCRFLQPSLPSYMPQGEPGYCIPSPSGP
ncbi:hypothetical protein WEI85_35795 [Actinomycetes bacterium KLBMP 9797]